MVAIWAVASPGFGAREGTGRGTEGAEWGEDGGVPLPTIGLGSGEGSVPPPQKNFCIFISKW